MSGEKKKTRRIGNSIATRVTLRISLMLLAAIIILFIGTYHAVSREIYSENVKRSEDILGFYAKVLRDYSTQNAMPIDEERTDYPLKLGKYICDVSGADYVYIYEIDEHAREAHYIFVSFSDKTAGLDDGNHMIGYNMEGKLSEAERSVWKGERETATMDYEYDYGHEISTFCRITDVAGTKLMVGVDISYENVSRTIINEFLLVAVIEVAVLVGVGFAIFYFLKKSVSAPAQRISRRMQDFISDGRRSNVKIEIKGFDEYAMIASAFNSMTDDIGRYVENIQGLTREQANRQTELEIAAGIQRGLLPAANCSENGYDIRAMMSPAKDVGGDLYDYICTDDGRCYIVIADVSGKGISAAMFMSVTLTLIRQFAKMDLAPHEILQRTNDALAENNAEMLFATAFIGLYDAKTGSLTYSSAGHNSPYIAGRELRVLDGACGMLLGLYGGEEYTSETVSMDAGDTVFLYTDGVTEAVNTDRAFFGTRNLEDILRRRSGNPVGVVYDSVKKFSEGAEQFDDITMLALTVRSEVTLETGFEIGEFEKIKAELLRLPVSREMQLNLCLAAEEIFVNICSYAFENGAPDGEKIVFTLSVSDRIEIRFTDGGMPFNPLENVTDPDSYDIENQIGGLGTLLYISLTDGADYKYLDGKNILTLIKYFGEDNK